MSGSRTPPTPAPPMTEETATLGGSFRDPSGFVFRRDGVDLPPGEPLLRRRLRSPGQRGALRSATEQQGLLRPTRGGRRDARAGEARPPATARSARAPRLRLLSLRVVLRPAPGRGAHHPADRTRRPSRRERRFRTRAPTTSSSARPAGADRHALARAATRRADPWVAYRQFCQHFLAPLALMSRPRRAARAAAARAPGRSRARPRLERSCRRAHGCAPDLFLHLRVHARYQRRYEGAGRRAREAAPAQPTARSTGLLEGLRAHRARTATGSPRERTWADY